MIKQMNPVAGTSAGLTPMLQGRAIDRDKKVQLDLLGNKPNLKDIPEEKDEDEKKRKEEEQKKQATQTKKATNALKGLKGL